MDLNELSTFRDVLAREREDPEFRAEWDRTAFAREIAVRVVRYRTEQRLTQAQLAAAVGMKQPVIARLESGEQAPSLATLAKITAGTGIEFHLDVSHGVVALTA